MLSNLRLAFRLARRQPGFTAVAVLTLGLAIAANTSILSLLNGGLLRPAVPVRPEEFVCVYLGHQAAARDFRPFSHAEFLALRESNPVFTDIAAVSFGQVALDQGGQMHRSFAFLVSENFLALTAEKMKAGRFFAAAECRPNAMQRVVIASYPLWERAGLRPDFIGSTLQLNGQAYTVIGVTPAGFSGVSAIIAPELWLPLGVAGDIGEAFVRGAAATDLANPASHTLSLVGRLHQGLTLDTSKALLPPLAARLDALRPPAAAASRSELVLARPFGISPTPQSNGPLALLGTLTLGMAALVLTIACLNLANMLLARGAARSTEFAVRLALGGSRRQVVGQLLAEGFVIALLGGAVGCLLGTWGVAVLQDLLAQRMASMGFVVTAHFTPDWRVLLFTLAGCGLTTLLFSLWPALQSTRVDLVSDLKRQGGASRGRGTWERLLSGPNLLVTAQTTLSVALLFVAGLFLRAALRAGEPPVGLNADSVVVGEMDFSLANTPDIEARRRAQAVVDRLRALPDVRSAGIATLLPFANVEAEGHIARVTALFAPPTERPAAGVLAGITPGFLASLGVHLVRGRDFTAAEAWDPARSGVCLIDEGMATRLFPQGDALGQRVKLGGTTAAGEYEVIGVTSAHPQDATDVTQPLRRVYLPLAQDPSAKLFLAVKGRATAGDDTANLALVRQELRALDPQLPLVELRPFATHLADNFTLWQTRLGAAIFGFFGALALILAGIGIYGVKAYAITRRTREIGIRMALGADRAQVVRLVLGQSFLQLSVALAGGAGLSLLSGRLLAGYLVNVQPADPLVFGTAAACLTLATLLAVLGPARRAAQVDPLVALRTE